MSKRKLHAIGAGITLAYAGATIVRRKVCLHLTMRRIKTQAIAGVHAFGVCDVIEFGCEC